VVDIEFKLMLVKGSRIVKVLLHGDFWRSGRVPQQPTVRRGQENRDE